MLLSLEEKKLMNQRESVRRYFDDISKGYQEAYEGDKDDPTRTHIFNERKKIVLSLIKKQRGGRLLDIGCGPGIMTKEVLKDGFAVYNTDISDSMIERAKESLAGYGYEDKVYFKVCDVEHMDFDDSYFDVVLCIGLLEYLGDCTKALAIISRTLKPGGRAVISIPNRCSLLNKIDALLARIVFRANPGAFEGRESIRQHEFKTRKFAPLKFVREMEKYGLHREAMRLHGYRLASLRKIFPKLWIFLSMALNRINLFWPAYFLANDCVIEFRKDAAA